MVKVKFLSSISTSIGSFARNNAVLLPPEVAKPWIDQGICEKTEDKLTEGIRVEGAPAPVAPEAPKAPVASSAPPTSQPAKPVKPAKPAKR